MSEFITVQVGQCGNQIGGVFWPLALFEHGINPGGEWLSSLASTTSKQSTRTRLGGAFHSFFSSPNDSSGESYNTLADLEKAKVKARAVLIDMEDSVVARFRTGPLRKVFDETLLLTNYPGSGNNWAEGHYGHGKHYAKSISETVRKAAEQCDYLHGFLTMFSVGGGTGSGLGSFTLQLLADDFPDIDRFVVAVYPSGHEDVVTAPYNVTLATRILLEHATCVLPADNKALLDICAYLQNKKETIESAKMVASSNPYDDMNSIVVNMLLNFTSGSRFPGSLNMDMSEVSTNMVPFPKLHFLSAGISPLGIFSSPKTVLKQAEPWARDHQLIKVDPLSSIVLSGALLSRGAVSLTDIRKNVSRLQSRAHFAPWNSDPIKVGLCSVPPPGHPVSHLSLLNSSAVSSLLDYSVGQFDKLFRRKAHVHHYTQVEGFELQEFADSRLALQETSSQYKEIAQRPDVNVERLPVL